MDQNKLDQINGGFANVAMLLEDVLPGLLEPATSDEAAVSRLKQVIGLLEAIGRKTSKIEKILASGQ